MIRNLKTVGLAIVAVFAMSALGASAAQATGAEFSWGAGTTSWTITEDPSAPEQKLTLPTSLWGSLSCDKMHGSATVTGSGAKQVTGVGVGYWQTGLSTQEQHKCKPGTGAGGASLIFNTTSCHLRFNAGETTAFGESTGTIDLVNTKEPGSDCITFAVPTCTIHIPPQNGFGPFHYKTVKTGSKEEITVTGAANNLVYQSTGCYGNGLTEDGSYEGKFIIGGKSASGEQTDVTVT